MIVIFSEQFDYSTTKVMEYLFHYGEEVQRINVKDITEANMTFSLSNENTSIALEIRDKLIHLDKVKSIWFRRGGFYIRQVEESHVKSNKASIRNQINTYLFAEHQTLSAFFYESILASDIRVLGNPFVYNTKKLTVLRMAADIGLDIPETLITTSKEEVIAFADRHGTLITKAIQDNIKITTETDLLGNYTEEISGEMCRNFPTYFLPSLFQRKLDKKFEIRSFFLDGTFYSVAIFSQENDRTKIDFRKYDLGKPNRKAPFQLPVRVEGQLLRLLEKLKLNTASIDLVYEGNGRYVFLEINPVGQYDMVGKTANYQLDKKIALWLTKQS